MATKFIHLLTKQKLNTASDVSLKNSDVQFFSTNLETYKQVSCNTDSLQMV